MNPALAVAAEMVRAGHDVRFVLPESFRPAVEATGAALSPSPTPPPAPFPLSPDPRRRFALTPIVMTHAAVTLLPACLDELASCTCDVIVYDQLSIWGRLTAEITGGPAVRLCASYAINDRFSYLEAAGGGLGGDGPAALECFAASMHTLSRRYGVRRRGPRELLHEPAPLTVALIPGELQPERTAFDGSYRFAGPALRAPETSELGALGDRLARLGDPLVYASLGTLFGAWPEFPDICGRAIAGLHCALALAGFPAGVAARLLAAPHLPQLTLLARARAFITHAGMNSALESLRAGVPMVLVPQMPEQELTATRLAREGAGILIPRAELDAQTLHDALDELLTDPGYGARAAELGARFGSAGARVAAEAILDHVRPALNSAPSRTP